MKKCKCNCCAKNLNDNIKVGRQLIKAINGLEKIEKTPQFGLAYSIARNTLKAISQV